MTENGAFETENDTKTWTKNKENKEKKMDEETAGKEDSIMALIRDFCDYTSAHGPGRIYGSKQIIRKVLWSLLFIGAVTMFSLHIFDLFKRFQSRPLNTIIRLEHDTVSLQSHRRTVTTVIKKSINLNLINQRNEHHARKSMSNMS